MAAHSVVERLWCILRWVCEGESHMYHGADR